MTSLICWIAAIPVTVVAIVCWAWGLYLGMGLACHDVPRQPPNEQPELKRLDS